MSKQLLPEPLLQENPNRFILFPIQYPEIWSTYKKQLASEWTSEELDFAQDVVDWREKLTDGERHFLSHVLGFFSASDAIVNFNIEQNFSKIQILEVKMNYNVQVKMEDIHTEVYGLLIDTLIPDEVEKTKLFRAVENFPAIRAKSQWALDWVDSDSLAESLIAFIAVEGIFFSGSFCAIFYMKKRGLLPGLCISNELIARDEGMHVQFAVDLYNNHIVNKLSEERIKDILLNALTVEKEFITESLPASLIGMNDKLMSEYLEFVTDGLLLDLKCSKEFNTKNPFSFMDMLELEGKSNMFEKRETNYQKAGVAKGIGSVSFNEDF
jgi:ribonucleoside-diphosphate reductase beta chain